MYTNIAALMFSRIKYKFKLFLVSFDSLNNWFKEFHQELNYYNIGKHILYLQLQVPKEKEGTPAQLFFEKIVHTGQEGKSSLKSSIYETILSS